MGVLVSIGDFSRMTYLSVKALRHYHEVGLLAPARVDEDTGRRSYSTAQIPVAQVIRRFRDLDMPLEQIREVVDAPDLESRNRAIAAYLRQMEDHLDRTRDTVAALRTLLEHPVPPRRDVHYRTVPATQALAIREQVSIGELDGWWAAAFGELHRHCADSQPPSGPDAALYEDAFFETGKGQVTAFVPVSGTPTAPGRVTAAEIPAAELAVMTHTGSFADLDVTYAALGTIVAEHAVGVAGPIREYYLPVPPGDENAQCIEVGWPVFRTSRATS